MFKHTKAIGFLGFLAAMAPDLASADLQWVAVDGCANSISVAPNNVPWVVGCGTSLDKEIYYRQTVSSCGGSLCTFSDVWVDAKFAAQSVTTDYPGNAYAITSSGAVFSADFPVAQSANAPVATPTGTWSELSPTSSGYYAALGYPSPGGCISGLASPIDPNFHNEAFVTPNWIVFGSPPGFYGIGCSVVGDASIFFYNPPNGVTTWTQVDPQQNAAALRMAVFTQSPPTGLVQKAWVLNSLGDLFSYNGVTFDPMPGPAGAYSLTDHFVAATDGVFQWDDATQSWSLYMTKLTPNAPIQQIAHAGSMTAATGINQFATVGPSQLWGIDFGGGIYYADAPVVIH